MGASIGENIRRIRIRKGLSQKELAEKAGMSNVLLNNYEHGLRNPKAETLQRIAQALGVSPEVLQGEEMSEMQAKKRLYAIFSQFGGQAAEIGGKTLVCFEKLDLGALCRNYQIYRQRSAEGGWSWEKNKKAAGSGSENGRFRAERGFWPE